MLVLTIQTHRKKQKKVIIRGLQPFLVSQVDVFCQDKVTRSYVHAGLWGLARTFRMEERNVQLRYLCCTGSVGQKELGKQNSCYFLKRCKSFIAQIGTAGSCVDSWILRPWHVLTTLRCLDLDDTSSTAEALASQLKNWLKQLQNSEALS